MRIVATLSLLFAPATVLATVAFLPLASVDLPGDVTPRFDGIEVVELPTMRTLRHVAVAPSFEFITVSPDGRTLAVRETSPAPAAIAVYDAQTGALRQRWPTPACAATFGEATWHPLRPDVLIIRGACFLNLANGALEETPQTLGVNQPFDARLVTTSDRGNFLVVGQSSGSVPAATLVRVIDLRDPRNGRDYPGLNGWGVLGFGETTLLSQRGSSMRYIDLATGGDLGPVPMPAGWIPQPPYRAMADGTIIAAALGPPSTRQRLVRLRDRTTVGEFIAELPPPIGASVYLEIGTEYALFSNWLRPSCSPFMPYSCFAGPSTVTAIELSSGRAFARAFPTQALAAAGPVLTGISASVVPVPMLRAAPLAALAILLLALVAFVRRSRT